MLANWVLDRCQAPVAALLRWKERYHNTPQGEASYEQWNRQAVSLSPKPHRT